MRYKNGADRMQEGFLPACLDDYVGEVHICRVISAFTEALDMAALGFKYAKPKDTGCRPYDPRMMLNLYIYGYMNRVRSSRRLHSETLRNIEVMWLTRRLTPDDKTICNFRKDNTQALKDTFRKFTLMCRELNLYGGEVVAIDGTKLRANNSLGNNFDAKDAERALARIDKRINEYINELENADKEQPDDASPSPEKIREVLEKLKARKQKIEAVKDRLSEQGGVSIVDPDAKQMKQCGDAKRIGVCYNVQTAVDAKHKLLVDYKVTDSSTDMGNFNDMATRSREILESKDMTAVADRGYYDGDDIAACENSGIKCVVAKPDMNDNKRSKSLDPNFAFKYFVYDKSRDCYICPTKQELHFKKNTKHNKEDYKYYVNYAACRNCPQRHKCINGKHKTIWRALYQDNLDIVDERTKNNPDLLVTRRATVEHPFGTIKVIWGYRYLLCRSKPKVEAEMALTFMAYNLRRIMTILTEKNLDPAGILKAFLLFFLSCLPILTFIPEKHFIKL